MAPNSFSRRTIGQDCVPTSRHFTAGDLAQLLNRPTAKLASKTSTIGGYVETSSIAQKSLANDAPLMGELSALTFDPVTYS
jgi:hypothetical protein